MKNFLFAIFIALSFLISPVFAETTPEEENLLKETLALSFKIKEFERTIGMEPSEIFTKTSNDAAPTSFLRVWVKNFYTTPFDEGLIMLISVRFKSSADKIPELDVNLYGKQSRLHSYYFRIIDAVADPSMVITVNFAKYSVLKKARIIIHEDLHLNDAIHSGEKFVTPLGDIAALTFFKNQGDDENVSEMQKKITELRQYSKEINTIVKELQKLYKGDVPFDKKQIEALKIVNSYLMYSKFYNEQMSGQDKVHGLEAKFHHDFEYYRYYDDVWNLYEKNGQDLKSLVAELRNAENASDGFSDFFDNLKNRQK